MVPATTDPSTAPSSPASTSSNDPTAGNADASTSTSTSVTVTGTKRKATGSSAAALKKQKQAAEVEFKVGGQPQVAPKKGKYENRTPGVIQVCAECGKRFTVTKVSRGRVRIEPTPS